jgi:Fe-S-cluster containining protein
MKTRKILGKAERDQILSRVRVVYQELQKRPVERACVRRTECCQFKLTGLTPYLTKGEALVAAKAFKATGRRSLLSQPNGECPLLQIETGKCLIYESRPFGCRSHFCRAAGGPYSRGEVVDLIRELEAVDALLSGSGPKPLDVAVEAALSELG